MKYLKFSGLMVLYTAIGAPLFVVVGWLLMPFFYLFCLYDEVKKDWAIARTRTPDKFDELVFHGFPLRHTIECQDIEVKVMKKVKKKVKGVKLEAFTQVFADYYAFTKELKSLRRQGIGRVYLHGVELAKDATTGNRLTLINWAYSPDVGAKPAQEPVQQLRESAAQDFKKSVGIY